MDTQIATIRNRFESELHETTGERFHSIDIARVRTEDWQIRRYLLEYKGDTEEAYRKLITTLEWKQSIGAHLLTESDFPSELYKLFKAECFGQDRSGRPLFAESYQHQRQYPEMAKLLRKMVVMMFEKLDRFAAATGIAYLIDMTGVKLHKLDTSLANYRIHLLNQHYPQLAKCTLFYNTPTILKPALKLLFAFMKPALKETVLLIATDELPQYIDPTLLHVDLGGRRTERHYPVAVSFRQCCHHFNISLPFVEHFLSENDFE